MPIETVLLNNKPIVFERCPRCGAMAALFLRGQVQRSKRVFGFLWKRDYCAVICRSCKAIVGWESP